MIARASALIGALSGSLGSVTAKNTRTGLVLAHRPAKINPQTARQLIVRSRYLRAIAAWRAMTAADRRAWQRLAQTFPHTNTLGVSRALSGFQLAMKINLLHLLVAETPIPAPPALAATALPTEFAISFAEPDKILVTVTLPDLPPVFITALYFGRSFSFVQPRFFDSYLFAAATKDFTGGATIEFTDEFVALQGPPKEGEWIYTQIFVWDRSKMPSQKIFRAIQFSP